MIGVSAQAQQPPLSAIDWLDSLAANPITLPQRPDTEPGVTDTALTPDVSVMPLAQAQADAVGLLPSSTTGLPMSLWSASRAADLTDAFSQIALAPLPALQSLYYTLLLAEADPPADAGPEAQFLHARVDALTRFGAVDPARALIERADPLKPGLFDPWLDLALLSGTEDQPCHALHASPTLTENYAFRVFCSARAGDWPSAALTYETAVGLDALTPSEATLLALYLDPETIETAPPPTPPGTMTPLIFRLFEAAGNPLPTGHLPRAYAMADLRGNSGWRAEIEATERLARTGALPVNLLIGLYTSRKPAASGGVWDRVRAIQSLDLALEAEDADAVAEHLPIAWQRISERDLQHSFAELFAGQLRALDLSGPAREISFRVTLLSEDYELAGKILETPNREQRFLIGLATGSPDPAHARTSREIAIARAFGPAAPPDAHTALIESGKTGQAILAAARQLDRARQGSFVEITEALATLRALGLEDTSRRAALQILLLENG